jgi:hypothetical protein
MVLGEMILEEIILGMIVDNNASNPEGMKWY